MLKSQIRRHENQFQPFCHLYIKITRRNWDFSCNISIRWHISRLRVIAIVPHVIEGQDESTALHENTHIKIQYHYIQIIICSSYLLYETYEVTSSRVRRQRTRIALYDSNHVSSSHTRNSQPGCCLNWHAGIKSDNGLPALQTVFYNLSRCQHQAKAYRILSSETRSYCWRNITKPLQSNLSNGWSPIEGAKSSFFFISSSSSWLHTSWRGSSFCQHACIFSTTRWRNHIQQLTLMNDFQNESDLTTSPKQCWTTSSISAIGQENMTNYTNVHTHT